MSQKPDKPANSKTDRNWTGAAALAGAAIGSAALAAALMYASRRKEPPAVPPHPEQAPETD
jgi:hypothetical protein